MNTVIDLEASGLYGYSYPVSVAWGSHPDNIEYHVIRPEPDWLENGDWDAKAEDIHGFTIERLMDVGEPAAVVANRIAEALRGRVVYSDAPDWDTYWLDVLHKTTHVERTYDVEDIAKKVPVLRLYNDVEIYCLREQMYKRTGAIQHTADGDVKMLLAMLEERGV